VVEVEMTGDNKVAKVLISVVGSEAEKKTAVKWLQVR
jgi:ribosome-binding factor A